MNRSKGFVVFGPKDDDVQALYAVLSSRPQISPKISTAEIRHDNSYLLPYDNWCLF